MKLRLSLAASYAALSLGLAAPVGAQQPEAARPESSETIREALIKWPTLQLWSMRPTLFARKAEEEVAAGFALLDANGDGTLDAADQQLHRSFHLARVAASWTAAVMAADLDGDGAVTREEGKLYSDYMRRTQMLGNGGRMLEPQAPPGGLDPVAQALLSADADGDGRVTYVEALAFARSTRPLTDSSLRIADPATQIGDLLAFAAPDGKGLTLDAFRAAVARIRSISAAPPTDPGAMRQAREKRLQAEEQRARVERCKMPAASDGAKVVLVSAREADKFSNVAIGSQATELLTGVIDVEPGDQPIYLVAKTLRGTLWRFTGATHRVERVVLHASETGGSEVNPQQIPLVGATGVAKEKVTFLTSMDCMEYFSRVPSVEATLAAGQVREGAGREPVVFADYRIGGFAVPSGKVIEAVPGATVDPPFGPDIDPAQVVASLPATRFDVYPGQVGLHQLEKAGALRGIGHNEYLVTRKLRLPLGVGHARFLIQRGVPDPEGDRAGLCVVREETGKALDGSLCR